MRRFWELIAPNPGEDYLLVPGRVGFRRLFGWPGRLDPHERVWLTFTAWEAVADVWLNGQFLGNLNIDSPSEFDITPLLRIRNDLRVVGNSSSDNGTGFDKVALEVRCSAFLRGVRFWLTSGVGENSYLHAAGEVVGTCDQLLELYFLLDQTTVGYAPIASLVNPTSFHLEREGLPLEFNSLHYVRLDLVAGASIWFTLEQPLSKV